MCLSRYNHQVTWGHQPFEPVGSFLKQRAISAHGEKLFGHILSAAWPESGAPATSHNQGS
jgi:hypothetical protein